MKKVLLLITALFVATPSLAMFQPIQNPKEAGAAKRDQKANGKAKGAKRKNRKKETKQLRKSPNPAAQKKADRKLSSPHGDLDRQSPFAGQMPASDSE